MASQPCLTDIPSEIRVLIYQFLFDLDRWNIPRLGGSYDFPAGCCNVNFHNDRIYTRRRWGEYSFTNFTAILRTCSRINKEAIDVLYEQTIFQIKISDEQYNRRMRFYGPVEECTFLPRIQQVRINADVRQHSALLALPENLTLLFRLLDCPASKITVGFEVTTGSLSGFSTIPVAAYREEETWQKLVQRLAALRSACCWEVRTPFVRRDVQERSDQLVRAVTG